MSCSLGEKMQINKFFSSAQKNGPNDETSSFCSNVQFLQKTARLLPCRFFRISTISKKKKIFFSSSKCSILCKKRQDYYLAVFSKNIFNNFFQFQTKRKKFFFYLQYVQFLQKTARLLPCRFFRISTILKKKFFFFFKMFFNFCKKRARLLPCRFFQNIDNFKKNFFSLFAKKDYYLAVFSENRQFCKKRQANIFSSKFFLLLIVQFAKNGKTITLPFFQNIDNFKKKKFQSFFSIVKMFNFCKKRQDYYLAVFSEYRQFNKKKKFFHLMSKCFLILCKKRQDYYLAVFSESSIALGSIFSISKKNKIYHFFHRQNVQFLQKTARLLPCRFFRISTISTKKNFFFSIMFFNSLQKTARLLPCRFFKILTISVSKKKFFFLSSKCSIFAKKRQDYYLAVFSEYRQFQRSKKIFFKYC